MKFILGIKKEMTQKFKEDGTLVPVTVLEVGPCVVTQLKKTATDGYSALQIAWGNKKHIAKPQQGHFKDLGSFRLVREHRLKDDSEVENFSVGMKIEGTLFTPGDHVNVTSRTKGRGFQGVVKRHNFSGSPKTHGNKDQLRMSGSIGNTAPQNVDKGRRMAGRMGGAELTVKNLEVVEVDAKSGCIFVKGAVPGARGSMVMIQGVS